MQAELDLVERPEPIDPLQRAQRIPGIGQVRALPVIEQQVDAEQLRREVRARKDELFELLEFRRILEPAAAALAAVRAHDEEIADMVAAQVALRAATSKDESRRADTAFHLAVARTAGNLPLERAIEDARALMFTSTDVISYEFGMESSFRGHARLIEAIRQRDSGAAAEAMRDHLDETVAELQQLLLR